MPTTTPHFDPQTCTRARTHKHTHAHTTQKHAHLNKELEALLVVLDVGGEATLVADVARVLCSMVFRLERIEKPWRPFDATRPTKPDRSTHIHTSS